MHDVPDHSRCHTKRGGDLFQGDPLLGEFPNLGRILHAKGLSDRFRAEAQALSDLIDPKALTIELRQGFPQGWRHPYLEWKAIEVHGLAWLKMFPTQDAPRTNVAETEPSCDAPEGDSLFVEPGNLVLGLLVDSKAGPGSHRDSSFRDDPQNRPWAHTGLLLYSVASPTCPIKFSDPSLDPCRDTPVRHDAMGSVSSSLLAKFRGRELGEASCAINC